MKYLQKNKTNYLLSQALIELIQEKEFEQIKLNEICDKALVHKTTFYNHFADKYELLNYLIKDLENDILSKVTNQDNIIEYYLAIAKEFIKNIKNNDNFYQKILTTNQNGICTNIIYNTFINDFKEMIKDEHSSIPTNYVSIFYINAVFSVIIEWVSTGMKDSEEDMITYIRKLVTNDIE